MKNKNGSFATWGCIAAVLLAVALVVTLPLAAQEGKAPAKKAAGMSANDKGTKSRGGGEDANIKKSDVSNDPNNANMMAPNKSKEKSRGAGPYACEVHVDNQVALYINIYVDGNFVASVSPGGDLLIRTGNGPTSLYGKALFTDGSSLSWGPRAADCEGTYTWHLTP